MAKKRSNREVQRRLQRMHTDMPVHTRIQVPNLHMEIIPDQGKVVFQYNQRIWWHASKPDDARRMAERILWCADVAEGKLKLPEQPKLIVPT